MKELNKDERLQHEWYSRLNQKIQVLKAFVGMKNGMMIQLGHD